MIQEAGIMLGLCGLGRGTAVCHLTPQVDLPYNHAVNYLKILDLVFEEGVAQMTWSILNDAYVLSIPHSR